MRVWAIAKAFELGMSVEEVFELTRINEWFLSKLHNIHRLKKRLETIPLSELERDKGLLLSAKRYGFSDRQIAACVEPVGLSTPTSRAQRPSCPEEYTGGQVHEGHVRIMRRKLGIRPFVKQIDTLAAEFPAMTNYLYVTYNGSEHDVEPSGVPVGKASPKTWNKWRSGSTTTTPPCSPEVHRAVPKGGERFSPRVTAPTGKRIAAKNVVVLGCGPYRIGSSVEFDTCSVWCIPCGPTARRRS